MRLVTIFSAFVVPVVASVLQAQGQWTQLTPSASPPGRQGHGMTTDIRRGVAVMFGGLSGALLNDTWEWNGTAWSQRSPATSPSPRQQFAMAYDLVRGVTLLYGGAYEGDTWQYDGTTWTQRFPASSPGVRCCSYMAYDARRARIVLFGGYSPNTGLLGDTWEWDGTNWTQVSTSVAPSPRCCGAMVYDSARNVCVLFGGTATLSSDSDETWEYDGTTWTQRKPPLSPAARRGGTFLAFDVARARTVLFGGGAGGNGNPSLNDNWEWDGDFWIERKAIAKPSVRFLHAITYLQRGNSTVLFGGYDRVSASRPNDTWTYTASNTAQYVSYGPSCRGSGGMPMLAATASGPWVNVPFGMRATSLPPSGAAALFIGASRTSWGSVPLPLKLDAIGMTGCELATGPDLVLPAPIVSGFADWTLPLPNMASLVGSQFYSQAFVFDSGANSFGATLSNGRAAQIGDL